LPTQCRRALFTSRWGHGLEEFFSRLVNTLSWKKYVEENQVEDVFLKGRDMVPFFDERIALMRSVLQQAGVKVERYLHGAKLAHFCSMKIAQDMRDYAAQKGWLSRQKTGLTTRGQVTKYCG
jgi:hypothetical protein